MEGSKIWIPPLSVYRMIAQDGNDSAGLRIYCADRKKAFRSQTKIPSPKAILHGFLPITVRVRNSYTRCKNIIEEEHFIEWEIRTMNAMIRP